MQTIFCISAAHNMRIRAKRVNILFIAITRECLNVSWDSSKNDEKQLCAPWDKELLFYVFFWASGEIIVAKKCICDRFW